MAVDHDRILDRALQPLGHPSRVERAEADLAGVVGVLRRAVDEHDELVATEAGQLVADTHHRTETACHVAEEIVADAVAEAVVDDLEVVEVDEQHGDLVEPGGDEQLVEAGDDRRSVRELGERIVGRRVGQAFGGDPLLGDVLDVRDREGDSVLFDHRHLRLGPDEFAVASQVALFGPVGVVDAEFDPCPLPRGGAQVRRGA